MLYFLILFGLFSLYLSAFYPSGMPSPFTVLQPIHSLAYFIFRSSTVLRVVFIVAISVHCAEATYALVLVSGHPSLSSIDRLAWTVQTLMCGYPSLRLLKKALRRGRSTR
jgi:hypothetical protein